MIRKSFKIMMKQIKKKRKRERQAKCMMKYKARLMYLGEKAVFVLSKGQACFFQNRNPAIVCFADFIYILYVVSTVHLARFQMLC